MILNCGSIDIFNPFKTINRIGLYDHCTGGHQFNNIEFDQQRKNVSIGSYLMERLNPNLYDWRLAIQ